MIVRVDIDPGEMQRAIDVLKVRARPAIARALNRTAANAKTAIVRAIATDLGLRAGDVRDLVVVQNARPEQLAATFRASAKRIPLIDFKARGPEPSRGRGNGVSARLPTGAGRYPHAFIATMPTGHRGVFHRKGNAKRLPIVELKGPSIWQSFQKNLQVAVDRAREQLTTNLQHELEFALSRA